TQSVPRYTDHHANPVSCSPQIMSNTTQIYERTPSTSVLFAGVANSLVGILASWVLFSLVPLVFAVFCSLALMFVTYYSPRRISKWGFVVAMLLTWTLYLMIHVGLSNL